MRVPPDAPRRLAARHPRVQRSGRAAVAVLCAATLVGYALSLWLDPRLPDATGWQYIGVLAVVAVAGAVFGRYFRSPDNDLTPPWDVEGLWLCAAALLLPPAGFAVLVAVSAVITLTKTATPVSWRLTVLASNVLTMLAVHLVVHLVPNLLVAAPIAVAVWIGIDTATATMVGFAFSTAQAAALWLDSRWTSIELACVLSAVVTAAAMQMHPLYGLGAIAPLLLATFSLRWPELDQQSRTDAKTGLPNARSWTERTRHLLSAAELRRIPVSVLMLDIDHFKRINDTYGHLSGDEVLVGLAATLRSQVGPGDILGRFGGEEFVITMFDIGPDESVQAADRIRRVVARQVHRFGHIAAADADRVDDVTLTCTIGIASSAHHGYDPDRLLDLADMALAAGKAAGRDQARLATDVLAGCGTAPDGAPGNAPGMPPDIER